MVGNALSKMKEFHDRQEDLHKEFGMEFSENTGRRNVIMSAAQEKFFAREIASHFSDASSDGGTGQPDIVIPSLGKELECKITTRRKKGGYSFQTDYATLKKKGSLDYLYVLAAPNFESFAVIFFEKLTVNDFHKPAPGSRGKSQMKKSSGMKKATILHGQAVVINDVEVSKQTIKFVNTAMKAFSDVKKSNRAIFDCSPNAIKKKARLSEGLERRMVKHSKRMQDIIDRTTYWNESDNQYKFILDEIQVEKTHQAL